MLVAGLVTMIFGTGYILRQASVADTTADWLTTVFKWTIRRLRAHAASRRAADAAYREKWCEHEQSWIIEEASQ